MTSKSRETIGNLKKMAEEDERENPGIIYGTCYFVDMRA